MAVYFLNVKTASRSSGSSSVSLAAYRAGERIRDERTGRTYDHSGRLDVMHKEIVLPSRFSGEAMAWARDRAGLWNTAERAETRINSRVAREFLVALPVELSPEQRLGLVRGFSKELSDRYGFAVDFVIHAPRDFPGSDPRNFHAHMLATTREVAAEGLGAKTTFEMNGTARAKLGLGPGIRELFHVRERWANVTNHALEAAHVPARVDHRTLKAQGIDREPRPYLPKAAFEMERHGYRSVVGDRMREEYRMRVEARLERSSQLSVKGAGADRPVVKPRSAENIWRETVQMWQRWRESWFQRGHQEPAKAQSQKTRGVEGAAHESAQKGLPSRDAQIQHESHGPDKSQRQKTRDVEAAAHESAQKWQRSREAPIQRESHGPDKERRQKLPGVEDTAHESAQMRQLSRGPQIHHESHSPGMSQGQQTRGFHIAADQSFLNWQRWREEQIRDGKHWSVRDIADESARNWRRMREAQARGEGPIPSQSQSKGRDRGPSQSHSLDRGPSPDNDYCL